MIKRKARKILGVFFLKEEYAELNNIWDLSEPRAEFQLCNQKRNMNFPLHNATASAKHLKVTFGKFNAELQFKFHGQLE